MASPVYPASDQLNVFLAQYLLGWRHNEDYTARDEEPWLDGQGNQRSWNELPRLTYSVEGARTIRDCMSELGWELELGDPRLRDGELKRIISFSHPDGTTDARDVPARDDAFPYFLGLVAYIALEKHAGRDLPIRF